MTHTLIFAWRDAHIAAIRARAHPDDLVVSLHLDASVLLHAAGIPFYETTDFLTPDDLRALPEQGFHLAQSWFRSFEADCRLDGVSPLAISAPELATGFSNALIARWLFNAIADRHPIGAVALFPASHENLLFTDTTIQPEMWIPLWRMMAQQRAVQVIELPIAPEENPQSQPVHRAGQIDRVRQIVRLVGSVIGNRIAWERQFARARRAGASVAFVVMINEAHRFADLHQQIAGSLDVPLIPAVVGARRSGGVQSYRAMLLLPGVQSLRLLAAGRRWYARFLAFQRTYQGEFPELFANPEYARQFHALFTRFLPDSSAVYTDAYIILRRSQARAAVITTYPQLHVGSVHAAARDLNIPVFALPHSGGPTDRDLRFRGDHTLIWSRDYQRAWRATQGDTPFIMTGMPTSIVQHGYPQQAVWRAGDHQRRRITLLLATVQVGMRPWVDVRRHSQTLRRLADVPAHLRDRVEVIFKLHPVSDYRHAYQAIVPEDAGYVRVIRDVPLETVLLASDLALLVNVSTSAHLLALAEGIPLLYLSTVGDTIIHDYLAIADWGGDAMTVLDDESVWARIESVLFDDAARARLLDANRRYWAQLEAAEHDPARVIGEALKPLLR
jgi:hypothetical protein